SAGGERAHWTKVSIGNQEIFRPWRGLCRYLSGDATTAVRYEDSMMAIAAPGLNREHIPNGRSVRPAEHPRAAGSMAPIVGCGESNEKRSRLPPESGDAQRLSAIEIQVGSIAHDLNNIVTAILGYGERALGDAVRGSRLHRDLEMILAAGKRARSLLEQ